MARPHSSNNNRSSNDSVHLGGAPPAGGSADNGAKPRHALTFWRSGHARGQRGKPPFTRAAPGGLGWAGCRRHADRLVGWSAGPPRRADKTWGGAGPGGRLLADALGGDRGL